MICVHSQVANINGKVYAGTWSEVGSVYIHDITEPTAIVDDSEAAKRHDPKQVNLVQVLTQHSQEGFAIDWSPAARGTLLFKNHCQIWQCQWLQDVQ